MNYTNIIRQITPRREAFAEWQSYIPALFAILVVIFFGLMLYFTFITPEAASVAEPAPASVETNPELSTYNRFAADLAARREASFLATNPEVGVYQRYLAEKANQPGRNFLAVNPEFMSASLYVPGNAVALAKAKVFAANPELMIYERYKAAAEAQFLAQNPEINAYRRFINNQ